MVREDTDVRDDDNVEQMNYCWTEQNMAGEDTDVRGRDDVDDLDEMFWNVESEFSGKSQNDKFSQIIKDYETPLFSGCKREHN
jgi:phage-related minor tail protein